MLTRRAFACGARSVPIPPTKFPPGTSCRCIRAVFTKWSTANGIAMLTAALGTVAFAACLAVVESVGGQHGRRGRVADVRVYGTHRVAPGLLSRLALLTQAW